MRVNDRKQRVNKRYRSSSDTFKGATRTGAVQAHQSEFDALLVAQRLRHEEQLKGEVSQSASVTPAPKAHIPGFDYDPSTDRYYQSSGLSKSKKGREAAKDPQNQSSSNAAAVQKSDNSAVLNYIKLLTLREMGSNSTKQINAYLSSKAMASSIQLNPLYCENNNLFDANTVSDNDISYHPVFGLARTSAHSISTYDGLNYQNTAVNLMSFTRLGGSSNPHWRPSVSESFNEKIGRAHV